MDKFINLSISEKKKKNRKIIIEYIAKQGD